MSSGDFLEDWSRRWNEAFKDGKVRTVWRVNHNLDPDFDCEFTRNWERKEKRVSSLSFKPGTRVAGLQPEMLVALNVTQQVYGDLAADCVVIGCRNGGATLEFSTNALTDYKQGQLVSMIRKRLPLDFDVALEEKYLRVEYQPPDESAT